MKSANEQEIKVLIENWAEAVRNRDINGILAFHTSNIVMFDVPEKMQSIGIEAYKDTWDVFFAGTRNLGVFDITELNITAGAEVAVAYAIVKCSHFNNDVREDFEFRLTIGLKKVRTHWLIFHEHHSVPAK